MDTGQLQAFDQIVRQGSFSKAARLLDLSQPTISSRIQKLEETVGGALFHRGGKGLELTDLGRTFLPYARQALDVLAAGIETAQMTVRGEHGRVTIGTLPTLATGLFSAALARLREEHPSLHIVVHTGHNQQIVEMLHDGFVKVGLMTWPFFSTDLTRILQICEPLHAVVQAGHPLARRGEIEVADLYREAQPFYQIDWSADVKNWHAQMRSGNEAVFEVPPQTAYDLIRRGTGAGLLTRSFIEEDLKTGRLVELNVRDLPALHRESALVRLRREEPLPPAVEQFVRILSEEAKCLYITTPPPKYT